MQVSKKVCLKASGKYIQEARDWANGVHKNNHYRLLDKQSIEKRYYSYLLNAVTNLLYAFQEGRVDE